ncbi:MAG: tRNA (N(6)-L-threonylcarbamoyladenosine(37)-C(2))-methylthiotransferase MtaB [Alphaproteobacteria bacterium]|nr:tRNA (N(6)-L-threonylcarbamoyladenosine(37)-C(2))-methylthiotransferase MtaB [Alphaproteobacteria bacterium]
MAEHSEIITFGCRLNSYESEVIRSHIEQADIGDIVIFNTCAVTGEAERQARQAIRKARRDKPDAKIIVTGCAAQIHPEKFAAMEEVDYVIGNDAKMKAGTYLALNDQKIHITDMQLATETAQHLVRGFEGMTRAFVQVQNGCDHRCTFCVIPYGRGPSRSVPAKLVVEQIRLLVEEQNYPEIALTGVDITSYGADFPDKPTLGQLVRHILAEVPSLKRLRLSSLDPVEVDEDLWALIKNEPRLMPHLHLSVQSGDDMILKRMARRHARQDIIALCERARSLRPDIVFGADIIAGFPTETDEMFENSCALMRDLDFTWLHVFPFSSRAGTPAARMPQVRSEIRKQRAAHLRVIGEQAVARHFDSLIGRCVEVHVEQPFLGRTPTFAEIVLTQEQQAGSIIMVECLTHENQQLMARPLTEGLKT